MKRHFTVTASTSAVKAAADITNGWWTQYYNSVSAAAAMKESGMDESEIEIELSFNQKVADNYGYKFRGYLDAKPEYWDSLDYLCSVCWFTDESGNIVIGELVNDHIYPVTQQDVIDQLTTEVED